MYGRSGFFSQPSMPFGAPPAPQPHGPSFNFNVGGGLPNPGLTVQGQASMPVSSSTTIWAQGGNNMPIAHPNVPTSSPTETQGSVGVTIRLGK